MGIHTPLTRRGFLRAAAGVSGLIGLSGLSLAGLAGCASIQQPSHVDSASLADKPEDTIFVIAREEGSGTRGAFTELLDIRDSEGEDATTPDAVVSDSTATVITAVIANPEAIGYISLGSLDDTVKALKIDGVAPSVKSIRDDTYKVARPFNVAVKHEMSAVAADFLAYILSADGQRIVDDGGYLTVDDVADTFAASADVEGSVTVAGSTSITPLMQRIAEAYMRVRPQVSVVVRQSDSTSGIQGAIDGTCDLGMASRSLREEELSQGVTPTTIAVDGIAVIVNKDNAVDGLTSRQVRSIYLGEVQTWSELGGQTGASGLIAGGMSGVVG